MIARILILLWHFAVLPALCPSGVLEHLCPDDARASCTHEEGCSSDPCSLSEASPSKRTLRERTDFDARVLCTAPAFGSVVLEPGSGEPPALSARALVRAPLRAFPLRN